MQYELVVKQDCEIGREILNKLRKNRHLVLHSRTRTLHDTELNSIQQFHQAVDYDAFRNTQYTRLRIQKIKQKMVMHHQLQLKQLLQTKKSIRISSNIQFYRSADPNPFIENIQQEEKHDASDDSLSAINYPNESNMLNLNTKEIKTTKIQNQVLRLSAHDYNEQETSKLLVWKVQWIIKFFKYLLQDLSLNEQITQVLEQIAFKLGLKYFHVKEAFDFLSKPFKLNQRIKEIPRANPSRKTIIKEILKDLKKKLFELLEPTQENQLISNRENFVSFKQLKELYLLHEKINQREEQNNKNAEMDRRQEQKLQKEQKDQIQNGEN